MATKTKDASTRIMKPKMPEPRPSVSLASLKAELMNDFSRYSNGSMAMTMGGVGGEITQNGKNVGSIYGALGGGIVVYLGSGDDKFRTVWSLSMKDIFIAVQEAVEQQYAKEA